MTPEQKQRAIEFIKCKNDPVYFCERYLKLALVGGDKLVPLYDRQKDFLTDIYKHHHLAVLKSRQTGLSTIAQMFCAHLCTFYKNVVIGVVSKSGSESTDFCRKTMSLIRNLPDWMRPAFKKDTEQTFILRNGCQFYAGQVNDSNPESLFRGKALTVLIIDEAAFISKIDEAYTSCAPTLFKSQTLARSLGIPFATLIISTPNKTVGKGKWYYSTWTSSVNGTSIFKPFKLHWKMIKELADDPTWYKTQCDLLGNVKWKIDQELDMQFVASSSSFLPTECIATLNKCYVSPIGTMKLGRYELRQFKTPEKNKFYIVGIDTASAGGVDNSTIEVFDYETLEQVSEFQAKLRVDEFCEIISTISKIYPNNLLVPEANSYGNQVCEYLTRGGTFYNIYQHKITKDKTAKNPKFRYGLYTGPQNRPLMSDALYTYVTEDPSIIKSERLALELIGLIENSGKVMADEGEKDDLALALMFCCYVKLYDPPLAISRTFTSSDSMQDFRDIASWNSDRAPTITTPELSEIASIQEDGEGDIIERQERSNKVINKHLKDNLHKIMQEGHSSNIDILKIIHASNSEK
jgi:hypothetical protein